MNTWDTMNDHTATISDRVAVSRRQSLLQVMSPKIIWTTAIDSEAISPEDFEPRRIEFSGNLGTDPSQVHEGFVRSSLTGDMEGFRKVGADVSYFQSQMHSEYDSAESIADSDLEDGELRKMLASPLYLQNREDCESSRMPIATAKLGALLQKRGASAKRAQADVKERLEVQFMSGTELHRRNLLYCCHRETKNRETNSRVLFPETRPRQIREDLSLKAVKIILLSHARSELIHEARISSWISQ